MTRAEEILALCRQMGAGEEQDELLLPLIEAAAAGLERRLKPGVAPEDCGQAFPLAAAMMAMEEALLLWITSAPISHTTEAMTAPTPACIPASIWLTMKLCRKAS